jgi:flagellar hook-length control protein FliK
MDFMIFSTSNAASTCEASKAAKPKNGAAQDGDQFDAILQQEEEKMSSEAEALMLAMLQKPQAGAVSDPTRNELSAGSNLPQSLVSVSLVETALQGGQQAAVPEQADGVGPSQSERADLIQTEVKPNNNQPNATTPAASEGSEKMLGSTDPISFQELTAEAVDVQDMEIDPKTIKANAEAKQRVDQASKTVIDPDRAATATSPKLGTSETVTQTAAGDPKPTETTAKEIEFSKIQVDQMTRSNTISEPARMAEALPRQTINQMTEQIEMLIQQGRSSLRVQLSPEYLGRIDIRLIQNSHGMSVTVLTEQAETGKLLEAQLDQLRQTLQDAGIQLSHLNIGQQPQGSKNPWQLPDHKGRSLTSTPQMESAGEQEIQPLPTRLRTESGVDYRI